MTEQESAEYRLDKIANTTDLKKAIEALEVRSQYQEKELKTQFHSVMVNLKPGNIIKSTLAEIRDSGQIKSNLLRIAIGMGAGYFGRKYFIDDSASLAKKALGTVMQFGSALFARGRRSKKNKNENTASSEANEPVTDTSSNS